MLELIVYEREPGRRPYDEWFLSLRDKQAQARIMARIRLAQAGDLGDCKPVGDGVLELRIHVGAGYRVYCGRSGDTWVILLCGGDKATQQTDIGRAKAFWADWKRRQR